MVRGAPVFSSPGAPRCLGSTCGLMPVRLRLVRISDTAKHPEQPCGRFGCLVPSHALQSGSTHL